MNERMKNAPMIFDKTYWNIDSEDNKLISYHVERIRENSQEKRKINFRRDLNSFVAEYCQQS